MTNPETPEQPKSEYFEVEEIEKLAIVRLGKEMDIYSAPDFNQAVKDLSIKDLDEIIVDFARTVFVDSDMLGALVGAHRSTVHEGKMGLTFANTKNSNHIYKLFEITGLDRVLTFEEGIDLENRPDWKPILAERHRAIEEKS